MPPYPPKKLVVQGGDELGFAVVRHLKFLPHGLTRPRRISCDTIFRMIEITICDECRKTINTEDDTFVIVDKVYYCYDCWRDV
jgi:hypothetical protein